MKIVNTVSKFNEKYGISEVFVYDEFNNVFKGKARCNKEDVFNKDFGEKLAYFRAKQKMLKKHQKMMVNALESTKKQMALYEQNMTKEINKIELMTNRNNSNLEEMLKNA